MREALGIRCPECGGSIAIHRSRTPSLFRDALMWLFDRRPYRCHSCGERFYAFLPEEDRNLDRAMRQ